MKVGRHFIILSSILLLLFLTTSFAEPEYRCKRFKNRRDIQKFRDLIDLQQEVDPRPTDEKIITCKDACATYYCLMDDEIIFGGACYSDFKKICTNSTEATIVDIEKMIIAEKRTRVEEIKMEPGNFLFTCKSKTSDCSTDFLGSRLATKEVMDFFEYVFFKTPLPRNDGLTGDNSTNTAAPSNNEKPTTAKPGNEGLMNQINGFKLFEMILLGFIFAQFW
uniref:Uncharacterized protein n=1 Tax=Panagrolaimus sp. ES5 TaxID=591445 RepID=A0AC34FKB7_9BILA